jgi:hypothetical protein
VTEKYHVALPAHGLHAVQFRLKSVSNEGHFTLETETVFLPYPSSHCIGMTEISHVALPDHAPKAMQVWSTSFSNEGHFTREAETFSSLSPLALDRDD